jgi:hypothetical protein
MEKTLLERYWDGETTPQEEAGLMKTWSHTTDTTAGRYFSMIAEARRQKSKLTLADIQAYNLAQQPPAARVRVVRPLQRWIASAAAVLLFAIAALGLWQYTHTSDKASQPMVETYEDPYEAYTEVREALAFVSAKLNKSQSEALVNIKKAGDYADMFK